MATRIKVLHIIKSLGRGGAEMLLPESLKLHDKTTFEFHYIYFLPWKNQMVKAISDNGGVVICISAKNNIQMMLRIGKVVDYIKKNDIMLIHAHLPWSGILARLAGKLSNVPVIYTEHNKLERYHWATRFVNLVTMNWLTSIISVSNDVAKSIYHYKPGLKVPVEKIFNGVNTEHYTPGSFDGLIIRQKLGIPPEDLVIGTVAVFRSQKRLDIWLQLAKQILEHNSQVSFIMVGDGPLKKELLEVMKELQLTKVHFVGLQTEVRPYLVSMDIFLMTSIFEGLPIALLEAMSSGCAVVATDAGGVKEVIRHGVDGVLCDRNNPFDLLSSIHELLIDGSARQRYSQAARDRIVSGFSMQAMVMSMEIVYRSTRRDHTNVKSNILNS